MSAPSNAAASRRAELLQISGTRLDNVVYHLGFAGNAPRPQTGQSRHIRSTAARSTFHPTDWKVNDVVRSRIERLAPVGIQKFGNGHKPGGAGLDDPARSLQRDRAAHSDAGPRSSPSP